VAGGKKVGGKRKSWCNCCIQTTAVGLARFMPHLYFYGHATVDLQLQDFWGPGRSSLLSDLQNLAAN